MPKRYINFLIVPEGSHKSAKLRLSFFAAWLILGLVGFLLVFITVFSVLHGQLLYQVIVGKSLKQENERLRNYNAKVVELEKELAEYKSFVQRVAELAGIRYDGQKAGQLVYSPDTTELKDKGSILEAPPKEKEGALTRLDLIDLSPDSSTCVPRGMPIEGWATRGFSMNVPLLGGDHPGIDFAAKIGTKVRVTGDGKVLSVVWDDMYGNLVAIDHGNGYVSYYGHNSEILVNVGDVVHPGDVIALSGNSGRSSAPHLHYEIRKDGVAIDPKGFLNQR